MKILFLTHFFIPEVGAATKRIYGLAKNLKNIGHDVEIIAGFPNYPSGIKPEGYRGKLYMEEEIDGLKVYRYYVYSSPKKKSYVRLLNYLSFTVSSCFFIFQKKKYDAIIVSSPPIFIGISGLIISAFKRIPLVYDVRDIWPDIALEMGEFSESSIVFKVMKTLADILYKKSRLITVVTNGKRDKLLSKGIDKNKVEIVTNGFDREFLSVPVNESLAYELNLKEGFNLVYTGVVGLAQGLDIIIEAASKLANYEDIRFFIIGDGFEKESLKLKAKDAGLTNIQFLGMLPHEKIITFLKHSGASIVPLKNSNLQDSVPTKMFEAMGAGCPVILSASGESAEILFKSRGGIVVETGNSDTLAEAILFLYRNPEKRDEMAKFGQEFVLNNYTRDKIAESLSNILLKHNLGGSK
ncbi:MAG TPA: glycosyltransferase family 4 protein [Clostridia bacterium]